MNLADFRARYPEFDAVSDQRVDTGLIEQANLIKSGAWSAEQREIAIGLATAADLWDDPLAINTRLEGVANPYRERLDRLTRQVHFLYQRIGG